MSTAADGSAPGKHEPMLAAIPRFLLTREDAAASLAMSLDSFERYVQPHVQMVRRGRIRLVPPSEVQRWAQENAEWAGR